MEMINDLEVFRLVAESGSFSEAGRRLDLAASSVARVIDRMESHLGVRLLLRTTRLLTLTAEGASYLAMVRRVLVDVRETESLITHQNSPQGRLRISGSIVYGKTFLVPLLGEFMHRYPRILIDINLTDSVVDIAAGQADVALRLGVLAEGPLTARRLGRTRKVVVASPAYLTRCGTPCVPEDLTLHSCINFNFLRLQADWPFRKGSDVYALQLSGGIETNNGDTQRQLALEGLGIARVCAETVADAIRNGDLVPLLEQFNPGDGEDIHVVFMGGAHVPARIRCFVDFLIEQFSR